MMSITVSLDEIVGEGQGPDRVALISAKGFSLFIIGDYGQLDRFMTMILDEFAKYDRDSGLPNTTVTHGG